ncbi:hypothetical protein [Methylophaga sp.]|jgi:vacuolar-type H+-ATPase subunit H|uniref:hypothetical protein n=1 Tax=Methylophaga sp. TaxID=2024840 RepID=UPI000C0E2E38|nr:hypothetical protein [Methylophaga sp.]MBL1458304.1 hypothetical protein [Methylophaga sp.]|tara:strand:+ start:1083 stop:1286 length:204 start_codon:yes stop_codon:yes gene_type:complete
MAIPIKDKNYDLISVVYHAAQGSEICRQYIEDAQNEGDETLAQFFREVQEQNQRLVEKGKELLKKSY